MVKSILIAAVAAVTALGFALDVTAQSRADPSYDEVLNRLLPRGPLTVDPLTDKGVEVNPDAPARPETLRRARVEGPRRANSGTFDEILFAFGSDRVASESMALVRTIAQAMQDKRLADYDFLIEGHTDAVGSDAYNQGLSERRARSVMALLRQSGISAAKLSFAGQGEKQLRYPNRPKDPANRRVVIVLLEQR